MKHNTRILIVDDNKSIHDDFRKVLSSQKTDAHKEVDDLEDALFGDNETETINSDFKYI